MTTTTHAPGLRLRALLAEPFLHFLVLAGLIFAGYAWLHPADGPAGREIVVGSADIERLRQLAIRQYGVAPDPARLRELVRNYIREEVLYREALSQGLERDDEIVRRRLVQKIEFLAQAEVRTPDEARLRAYYLAHAAAYSAPSGLVFEQVYFSAERHGGAAQAKAAALAALARLRAGEAGVEGDPSMFARRQPAQSRAELTRDFGADFAAALFAQADGGWSGPLVSALGLHLVRITARQPARVEDFAAVRERVLADLSNEDLHRARERAYAQARARYRVTLAGDAGADAATAAGAEADAQAAPRSDAQADAQRAASPPGPSAAAGNAAQGLR